MEVMCVCRPVSLGRVQREYLPHGGIAVCLEIRHNERAGLKGCKDLTCFLCLFILHWRLRVMSSDLQH